MLAKKGSEWLLWYSDLGSYDLLPVTYSYTHPNPEDEDSGIGEQVALFSERFTHTDIKARKGRGYAAIGQTGGKIFFLSSPDGIVPGPMKEVGEDDDRDCQLLVGATADGRERMDILDGNELQYVSFDGGTEWQRRE